MLARADAPQLGYLNKLLGADIPPSRGRPWSGHAAKGAIAIGIAL